MLLALDVGNTNITAGWFQKETLIRIWHFAADRSGTGDEYGTLMIDLIRGEGFDPGSVSGIAISTVVPQLDYSLSAMSNIYFGKEPLFIDSRNAGMPVLCDKPEDVGPDRIVNAVAAFERVQGACIVVDFGTATTFDVVSSKGEFLGGIISPGIHTSAEALFERAARLRPVEISRPDRVIGTNTVSSMQSGLYYGAVALADGVISRMFEELGHKPEVIATGGLGEIVSRESSLINRFEPHLTLEGIRIVYGRNLQTSH